MLTLIELQNGMREAILAAPARELLDEIVSDRIPACERIRIHRNQFRISLQQGLADVFPATRLFLGERYFDAMAMLFITTQPPRDPRLSLYGNAFPRFLASRDELDDLAYVVDVARMEWALAAISDAPDTPALDLLHYELAVENYGDDFTIQLAPTAMIFDSDWPVNLLRQCVIAGDDTETIAALLTEKYPVRLLLHRDVDGDACELELEEWAFIALRTLHAGHPVAMAVRAATVACPQCPAADLLEFLFEVGLVGGLSPIHMSLRDIAKEN